MLVRPVFSLAMKACPYRVNFYEKLSGSPDPEAKTLANTALVTWLSALERITGRLEIFYAVGGYGKGFWSIIVTPVRLERGTFFG